jgi:FHS family L-fucose permease-like MFS transporter
MNTTTAKKSYFMPMLIIGALFFIFGFVTWANSQLIPYLKIACELTTTQSLYVTSAFFAAYFIMALPSSFILKKTGYKNGMSLGLLVMAAGALLFIPAAQARNYSLFLTGLFIIGTGLALLQTASNPYVTVLGPIESAAQRISIMGICNKVAGILAVFVLGGIVLKDVDTLKARLLEMTSAEKTAELDMLATRVVNPYIVIAISLAVLAVVIFFLKLPEIKDNEETEDNIESNNKTSIFQFPHLVLGAFTLFFYVGVEVISYDTFAGFGEELGYKLEDASTFASYTGYGLLVSFALLGFSNAVVWPAIWPLALVRLGKFTKTGAALLIMGIVGGAIIPPLYGTVSEMVGSRQLGYLILIPCYLFILYFAVKGHKKGLS